MIKNENLVEERNYPDEIPESDRIYNLMLRKCWSVEPKRQGSQFLMEKYSILVLVNSGFYNGLNLGMTDTNNGSL